MDHDTDTATVEMPAARVLITPAAEKIVEKLRAIHGDLLFHQSGGLLRRQRPYVLPAR